MDESKINMRGPSNINLEGFECSICGKRRSVAGKRNVHAKCSKIKQAMYAAERAKAK